MSNKSRQQRISCSLSSTMLLLILMGITTSQDWYHHLSTSSSHSLFAAASSLPSNPSTPLKAALGGTNTNPSDTTTSDSTSQKSPNRGWFGNFLSPGNGSNNNDNTSNYQQLQSQINQSNIPPPPPPPSFPYSKSTQVPQPNKNFQKKIPPPPPPPPPLLSRAQESSQKYDQSPTPKQSIWGKLSSSISTNTNEYGEDMSENYTPLNNNTMPIDQPNSIEWPPPPPQSIQQSQSMDDEGPQKEPYAYNYPPPPYLYDEWHMQQSMFPVHQYPQQLQQHHHLSNKHHHPNDMQHLESLQTELNTLLSHQTTLYTQIQNLTSNVIDLQHKTSVQLNTIDVLTEKLADAEAHASAETNAAIEYKANCTKLGQDIVMLQSSVNELEEKCLNQTKQHECDVEEIKSLTIRLRKKERELEELASGIERARVEEEREKYYADMQKKKKNQGKGSSSGGLFSFLFGWMFDNDDNYDDDDESFQELQLGLQELARSTLLNALQNERNNVHELETVLSTLQQNNSAITEMVSSRDSLIDELNNRVAVFEEDKVVLKAALRQLQKEMKEEAPKTQMLLNDLKEAKEGIERLKNKVKTLQEQHATEIQHLNMELTEKENLINETDSKMSMISIYVDQLEERLASFAIVRREINEREEKCKEIEEKDIQMEESLNDLQQEIDSLTEERDELKKLAELLVKERAVFQKEKEELQNEKDSYFTETRSLKEEITSLHDDLMRLEDETKQAKVKIDRAEKEILSQQEKISVLESTNEDSNSKILELEATVNELIMNKAELEEIKNVLIVEKNYAIETMKSLEMKLVSIEEEKRIFEEMKLLEQQMRVNNSEKEEQGDDIEVKNKLLKDQLDDEYSTNNGDLTTASNPHDESDENQILITHPPSSSEKDDYYEEENDVEMRDIQNFPPPPPPPPPPDKVNVDLKKTAFRRNQEEDPTYITCEVDVTESYHSTEPPSFDNYSNVDDTDEGRKEHVMYTFDEGLSFDHIPPPPPYEEDYNYVPKYQEARQDDEFSPSHIEDDLIPAPEGTQYFDGFEEDDNTEYQQPAQSSSLVESEESDEDSNVEQNDFKWNIPKPPPLSTTTTTTTTTTTYIDDNELVDTKENHVVQVESDEENDENVETSILEQYKGDATLDIKDGDKNDSRNDEELKDFESNPMSTISQTNFQDSKENQIDSNLVGIEPSLPSDSDDTEEDNKKTNPIEQKQHQRSVPLRPFRKMFAKATGMHGFFTPSSKMTSNKKSTPILKTK